MQFYEGDIDAMVQLVEIAANSTPLKKLTCDNLVYEQLLPHVSKQYQYILHERENIELYDPSPFLYFY